MAKKNFDSFLNTVKAPKISPEEIEKMTREVHGKPQQVAEAEPTVPVTAKIPPAKAAARRLVQNTALEPRQPLPRGRKPKPPQLERTIRVSVDLPETTLINLKIKVTREQTDMKNFIRRLVETELAKEFK